MTNIDQQRLDRLEADRDAQRQRRIAAAARTAGFFRPADAVELIDPATVVTNADADKAVAALAHERPFLREQRITEEEQKRRCGQQILDAIDRA